MGAVLRAAEKQGVCLVPGASMPPIEGEATGLQCASAAPERMLRWFEFKLSPNHCKKSRSRLRIWRRSSSGTSNQGPNGPWRYGSSWKPRTRRFGPNSVQGDERCARSPPIASLTIAVVPEAIS